MSVYLAVYLFEYSYIRTFSHYLQENWIVTHAWSMAEKTETNIAYYVYE